MRRTSKVRRICVFPDLPHMAAVLSGSFGRGRGKVYFTTIGRYSQNSKNSSAPRSHAPPIGRNS